MKTNLFQLTAVSLCFTLLMSCGVNTNKQDVADKASATEEAAPQSDRSTLVGNDRDEHGCIASAGYQWSELLQDCIRPFEKGIRLDSSDTNQSYASYLVFNADSSRVELFLPKDKSHPILMRKTTLDGEIIWTGANEDLWSVRCIEHIWGIYFNNELRFVKYTDKE